MQNKYFTILAVLGLTACTQNEIDTPELNEVGFNAVVRKNTKAIITGGTFTEDLKFKVWGYYTQEGDFSDVEATAAPNFMKGVEISYIENDFSKDVLKEVEDIVCDVDLSGEVKFIDAGNGATHFIFSLPDEYWEKVIVVDVVDYDAEPGSVRTFSPFEMPRDKYENVHTYAVEEPLHELSEKCEVVIVGCKPGEITTPTVEMGLTEEVEKSVPDAIRLILNEIK